MEGRKSNNLAVFALPDMVKVQFFILFIFCLYSGPYSNSRMQWVAVSYSKFEFFEYSLDALLTRESAGSSTLISSDSNLRDNPSHYLSAEDDEDIATKLNCGLGKSRWSCRAAATERGRGSGNTQRAKRSHFPKKAREGGCVTPHHSTRSGKDPDARALNLPASAHMLRNFILTSHNFKSYRAGKSINIKLIF